MVRDTYTYTPNVVNHRRQRMFLSRAICPELNARRDRIQLSRPWDVWRCSFPLHTNIVERAKRCSISQVHLVATCESLKLEQWYKLLVLLLYYSSLHYFYWTFLWPSLARHGSNQLRSILKIDQVMISLFRLLAAYVLAHEPFKLVVNILHFIWSNNNKSKLRAEPGFLPQISWEVLTRFAD